MKTLPAEWDDAVLICGKCSKRLGGGFGKKGKTSLAKALRQYDKRSRGLFGFGKGRKAGTGIVETRCLGVCPRGSITALTAGHTREWLLIPAGSDAGEVALRLKLRQPKS